MHSKFVYIHTYTHTRIQMRLCEMRLCVPIGMPMFVCTQRHRKDTDSAGNCNDCDDSPVQALQIHEGISNTTLLGHVHVQPESWIVLFLSCGNFEYLVHLVAHVMLYE